APTAPAPTARRAPDIRSVQPSREAARQLTSTLPLPRAEIAAALAANPVPVKETGTEEAGKEETGKDKKAWRAPGLDGVRALAVLSVLGFHEGLSWLPGGFLGVDIFFVLSGFLITDILAAKFGRDGNVGLSTFWQRRARRLLPALGLMLVTVTAAV